MSKGCPFCQIQEISVRLVYQNEQLLAFLTNTPITSGHILICPKRHISKFTDLLDDELSALKKSIIILQAVLEKSLGAEGFNLAWNEGVAAGQSINHLHVHLVPRKSKDIEIYGYEPRKFLYRPGNREEKSEPELAAMAKLICRYL